MLKRTLIILVLLSVLSSGCQVHAEAAVKTDALYQVSLINALMQGDYDGTVSVGDLLMIGDTGIGTFDRLDGEMIMLDGVVYKAKADGSVDIQPDLETVPFAAVTFFDNDIARQDIAGLGSIDAMKAYLDDLVHQETGDYNRFYVAVIEGKFNSVHVRSVPEQTKPYKPLSEIAETQPEYIYESLEGTIVALRCPDFVEGINVPGWHLHFISKDKTKGGHMLNTDLLSGSLKMDVISEFNMKLPNTDSFSSLDLTRDLSSDTEKVESKK